MDRYETPLQMALRHVKEGEERVNRQNALVADLARKGLETAQAQALLDILLESLALASEGLDREIERANRGESL